MRIACESLLVAAMALAPLVARADQSLDLAADVAVDTAANAAADSAPWTNALPAEELDTLRGGADTAVYNNNLLTGSVGDNVANNLVTGNNSVAGGAFANASGLPVVIQNSGNNVLIQNSTIVNIQLQ